jgi:hypothetical protein
MRVESEAASTKANISSQNLAKGGGRGTKSTPDESRPRHVPKRCSRAYIRSNSHVCGVRAACEKAQVHGTLIVMKLSIVVLGVVAVAGCAASADQPAVAPTLDHQHAQVHRTEAVAVENASHLDRGLQLYSEENYAEAAREFEQAYSLAPAPSLLLAQAQALRLAGACEEAAPLYEAFLREAEPTHGTAVRKLARDCR